ncbi:MAG: NAD(P)H-quinone oxidoreductase [Clostridia bacterium]|nr:NAD(P)H-quinone oxidoreductase [Clostridia bacterium]MBQ4158185.1 NAD(P)H-quinone oxidoreductase [Clostridia bacterium]
MKAILQDKNDRLIWTDVPDPVLKDGDVLLEIHAAALNRADLLQRAGQYPPPDGWPEWFGLEAAGVIKALSPCAEKEGKWHVGDKVCALLGGGGYAEYVAVPSGMLMPIPKGVSMAEAAAIPEVFGAAYLFLFYEGKLKKGDTVLMQAGASGLASVLIPMAKAYGARVITTVLSDEIAESIKHLNADMVINTSKYDLSEILKKELEAGKGVDIAVDCLGGETVGKCLPYINCWGRWIMIATLADDISNINLKSMYVRRTRLIGTTLRSRTSEEKAELLDKMVTEIWPKVETGEIRPTIWKTFPIQEAEEAQALMAAGKSVGKIVLEVK